MLQLVADLVRVMRESRSLGLSAPQLGHGVQVRCADLVRAECSHTCSASQVFVVEVTPEFVSSLSQAVLEQCFVAPVPLTVREAPSLDRGAT